MPFIIFLLIGTLSGFLAGKIMKGSGYGLLGNLIIGVIGSFVGGFLFRLVGLSATSLIGQIIAAVVGAVILLWLINKFKK